MSSPDILIITAANAAQARGYERQLRWRRTRGALGPEVVTRVVPDTDGRRIGSGASTLLALRAAAILLHARRPGARSMTELFKGVAIAVIHSGGDSRRLPAYAALGKAFTPLPALGPDGLPTTMFDEVLRELSAAARRTERTARPGGGDGQSGWRPGAVVASGDLLVGGVRLPPAGEAPSAIAESEVTFLAAPRPMETATRHGVFVTDDAGRLLDFLQKPSATTARRRGAVRPGRGRAAWPLVDTGVVSLSPRGIARWLVAAGVSLGRRGIETRGILREVERGTAPPIDLYLHLFACFAERIDAEQYCNDCAIDGPSARRNLLAMRQTLRRSSVRVEQLERAAFFHVGTTRELLDRSTAEASANEPIHRSGRTASAWRSQASGPCLIGSVITGALHGGRRSVIEGCELDGETVLEGDNLLVGIPRGAGRLVLPRGAGLAALPVGADRWAVLAFSDADDFKTSVRDGGTIAGAGVKERVQADPELWRGVAAVDDDCSAFDLRLWVVGSLRESLASASEFLVSSKRSRHEWLRWRAQPRASLRELLARVNHSRLIAQRSELATRGALATLDRAVENPGVDCEALRRLLDAQSPLHTAERASAAAQLERYARASDSPLRAARALFVASAIEPALPRRGNRLKSDLDVRAQRRRAEAFECIARGVAESVPPPDNALHLRGAVGGRVVVSSPARIDLAGGWSDTPPICNLYGGRVVNTAVSLEGRAPIVVAITRIAEPVIRIRSVDANVAVEVSDLLALRAFRDPSDPTALARAALCLMGFAPAGANASLARHLERAGGGIELEMSSSLPRGSGLGTSSILAAALIRALASLRGDRSSRDEVIERTSATEQMIATRGGWQDQVGGIVPGFKFATTEPGARQRPVVHAVDMPRAFEAELHSRSVLLFTGVRRMARGILETVVARVVGGEREAVEAIAELRDNAVAMRYALQDRDLEAVASELSRYGRLKRTVDPASSLRAVDAFVAAHRRDIAGWSFCGAGGGGFVLLLAHSASGASRLRRVLSRDPFHPRARSFKFDFDRVGATVSVE